MRPEILRYIRIGLIIVTTLIVLGIRLSHGDDGNAVIVGIILLGVILLLATTAVNRMFRLIGTALFIVISWLALFEVALIYLNERCLLGDCDRRKTQEERSIESYANFLKTLYPDENWRDQFSQELATIIRREDKYQFYPYVGFRKVPFDGEFAYINEQGLRPVPQSVCNDTAYNVVTMGNSAIWGQYEPNDRTLAALIQESIALIRAEDVCLINYSQGAWSSTQSLIQLINLIQHNQIPDMVIFYNGATDVLATSNYHQANVPLLTSTLARQVGTKINPLPPYQQLEYWARNTDMVMEMSAFLGLENTLPVVTSGYKPPYYLEAFDEISAVNGAEQTVDIYMRNYELVDLLATTYGFDFMFIVQPVSFFGEKPLTDKEQLDIKDGWPGQDKQAIYELTYASLKEEADSHDNLYFLGNIFDEITRDIYEDPLHPLPDGTQIIADEISQLLQERISSR